MTNRRTIRLLFLLALLLPTTGRAQPGRPAQPPTSISHGPIERLPGAGNSPEEMLTQRLRRLRGQGEAELLAQQLLKNPELLKKLAREYEQLRKDGRDTGGLDNETLRKLFEQYKGELPQKELSEEGADALKEMLERGKKAADEAKSNNGATSANGGTDEAKEDSSSLQKSLEAGLKEGANDSTSPDRLTPPSESGSSPEMNEWMLETMKRIQESNNPLGNSPALEKAIAHMKMRPGDHWMDFGKNSGLPSKMPDWAKLDKLRPEGGMPFMDKISLPKMPNLRMPNLGLGSIRPPGGFSGGGASLPNLSTGAGAMGILLWVFVFGILGVLILKLLTLPRAALAARLRGWQLGPWPVVPSQIRTREELVKAFDYFALLRLGSAARHWNHREIADRLGVEERHQAATQLAGVYEQARYAPASDELPEQDLARARRDLCLLAGVAGA